MYSAKMSIESIVILWELFSL